MSAAQLLERLHGARATGVGRWKAKCPAHEDRSPSLSIRELEDGRVLLHCFAGCAFDDVVGAVGLEVSDLFPPSVPTGAHYRSRDRQPFQAREVLAAVSHETFAVVVIAENMAELSQLCRDRLLLAARRIRNALDYAGHGETPAEIRAIRRGGA